MYKEAVDYILNIRRFTKKNSLDNTKYLLGILGNPQKNMKIIHVAGTNGKGSVCAYVNSILLEQGKSTGLFTSPHLVKINERIKINNIDISDEKFNECFEKVKSAIGQLPKKHYYHPTFFEFIFLMAMTAFDDAGVEYVVLETGLGGRLDATNAVEKPLVTVITQIDLDHTDILGDTIEKIAFEKAGIIKECIPVVYLDDKPEVSAVIKSSAAAKNAPLYKVDSGTIKIKRKDDKGIDFYLSNSYYGSNYFTIANQASYQTVNAALAVMTAGVIGVKDIDGMRTALALTAWAGRMELLHGDIYLDGAHNPGALEKLCGTIKELKKSRKACLLFSVMQDKDYRKMIDIICTCGCFDDIVAVPVRSPRASDTAEIASEFKRHGVNAHTADSVEEGLDIARSLRKKYKPEQCITVCAGSLYLIGEIKALYDMFSDKIEEE